MQKKKQWQLITLKCDAALLQELEDWREKQEYPVTRTAFIEKAMRQALRQEREASKRVARR